MGCIVGPMPPLGTNEGAHPDADALLDLLPVVVPEIPDVSEARPSELALSQPVMGSDFSS